MIQPDKHSCQGFTLIELSIVLVIIGLIVGGVLVGRDLIEAAAVRAQIAQIEKFNAAVNTFRNKYGALPGDMSATQAAQYGFASRTGDPSDGNGNGRLEAYMYGCITDDSCDGYVPFSHHIADWAGNSSQAPELALFWMDLAQAKLVAGSFKWTATGPGGQMMPGDVVPEAKIGRGSYVYAYQVAPGDLSTWGISGFLPIRYWVISGLDFSNLGYGSGSAPYGNPDYIPVASAYNIDKKIDDGLPQMGRVIAGKAGSTGTYGYVPWLMGDNGPGDTGKATPPSASSCYDDGGSTGRSRVYSVSQNNGNGLNCSLSIQFQ